MVGSLARAHASFALRVFAFWPISYLGHLLRPVLWIQWHVSGFTIWIRSQTAFAFVTTFVVEFSFNGYCLLVAGALCAAYTHLQGVPEPILPQLFLHLFIFGAVDIDGTVYCLAYFLLEGRYRLFKSIEHCFDVRIAQLILNYCYWWLFLKVWTDFIYTSDLQFRCQL